MSLPPSALNHQPPQSHRHPTERMLVIHDVLQRAEYPNCSTLAARFSVSPKTIKRDLEFMRDHLDLPIAYHPQRHGYHYSGAVKNFPGVTSVTEADMFALLVAHKAIAQYHGTPFHQPLQAVFQKFISQLDTQERYSLENFQAALSFRPFAPEDADLRAFELITQALSQRRLLTFHYRKPGAKATQFRRVHPYHLICSDNRWYLIGHDTARGDTRTFAVGRMTSLTLTPERFTKPIDFDLEKYLRGSFTVMKGDGDYDVVIEFDAWAADVVRGRQWHASQQVTELPGNGSRIQMRLSCLEEVERWVLSWGAHATVIRPQALADRVRRIAADVVRRYPQPADPLSARPSPRPSSTPLLDMAPHSSPTH